MGTNDHGNTAGLGTVITRILLYFYIDFLQSTAQFKRWNAGKHLNDSVCLFNVINAKE